MSLIPLNALPLVSCCLSIFGDCVATHLAGEDAIITMKIHLMPCPKDQLTEVFGAFDTAFNSCVKCFSVTHKTSNLGEVFGAH